MSEQDIDKDFRKIVDSFIQLANQHLETAKREHVGMALLYAAARFNAFVLAAYAADPEAFETDRQLAFDYFTHEYQRMLNENLDDHRQLLGGGRYAHLMQQH